MSLRRAKFQTSNAATTTASAGTAIAAERGQPANHRRDRARSAGRATGAVTTGSTAARIRFRSSGGGAACGTDNARPAATDRYSASCMRHCGHSARCRSAASAASASSPSRACAAISWSRCSTLLRVYAGCREGVAELFHCRKGAALDGADGKRQPFGQLGLGVARKVRQLDHLALLVGRVRSAARTCSPATLIHACSSTGTAGSTPSRASSMGSARRRCSRRTTSTAR